MRLLRIVKKQDNNSIYFPGNEFNVGDSINKITETALDDSCSILVRSEILNGKEINRYEYLPDYLKKFDFDMATPGQKHHLYKTIKSYLENSARNIREFIMEDVRREYWNHHPSRRTCLYLSDEASLSHWGKVFEHMNYEVYELSLDGNIFVSRDELLPPLQISQDMMYDMAKKYWNPTEKDLKDATDKEYLFEGHVKVLKRVK